MKYFQPIRAFYLIAVTATTLSVQAPYSRAQRMGMAAVCVVGGFLAQGGFDEHAARTPQPKPGQRLIVGRSALRELADFCVGAVSIRENLRRRKEALVRLFVMPKDAQQPAAPFFERLWTFLTSNKALACGIVCAAFVNPVCNWAEARAQRSPQVDPIPQNLDPRISEALAIARVCALFADQKIEKITRVRGQLMVVVKPDSKDKRKVGVATFSSLAQENEPKLCPLETFMASSSQEGFASVQNWCNQKIPSDGEFITRGQDGYVLAIGRRREAPGLSAPQPLPSRVHPVMFPGAGHALGATPEVLVGPVVAVASPLDAAGKRAVRLAALEKRMPKPDGDGSRE